MNDDNYIWDDGYMRYELMIIRMMIMRGKWLYKDENDENAICGDDDEIMMREWWRWKMREWC